MDWHPIQGEQQYFQSLNATEIGISSGLMGHLGQYVDFTFTLHFNNYNNYVFVLSQAMTEDKSDEWFSKVNKKWTLKK